MEVRLLRPDEYEQAGTVTAGAYREYEPVARGWDRWGQYLQELADVAGRSRHAVVLGAVDGGQVLGTVTVEIERDVDGVLRAPGDLAHLRMLAVDPTARRRGVARALMTQAIDLARASGRKAMILPTTPYMKAGHPLYKESAAIAFQPPRTHSDAGEGPAGLSVRPSDFKLLSIICGLLLFSLVRGG